jgi:ferredoxin
MSKTRRANARPLDATRAWARSRLADAGRSVFGPLVPVIYRQQWLGRLPPAPWRSVPRDPWPEHRHETPSELKTVPGIWRDPDAVAEAYAEHPMYSFHALFPEAVALQTSGFGWGWRIPSAPRKLRMSAIQKQVSAPAPQSAEPPPDVESRAFTAEIKAEATRVGLSQVGFAPFDPRYVFVGGARHPLNDATQALSQGSVIVCLLERDYKLVQTAPSSKCERSVLRTNSELAARAATLAEFVRARGFQVQLHALAAPLVSIHFAVEAGLGQLGLNGQLLTPFAGSRCSIALITTNSSLEHGKPVDYGIHTICDRCQICVKRCPPSAIPNRRRYHRGILKAKIKTERCLPTTIQAHACAICMKVCPIQRYGLDAVTDHLTATGEILGKGTDELEGYTWIDGRRYGPSDRPRLSKEFLAPGMAIDMTRKMPPDHGSMDGDEESVDGSL